MGCHHLEERVDFMTIAQNKGIAGHREVFAGCIGVGRIGIGFGAQLLDLGLG